MPLIFDLKSLGSRETFLLRRLFALTDIARKTSTNYSLIVSVWRRDAMYSNSFLSVSAFTAETVTISIMIYWDQIKIIFLEPPVSWFWLTKKRFKCHIALDHSKTWKRPLSIYLRCESFFQLFSDQFILS